MCQPQGTQDGRFLREGQAQADTKACNQGISDEEMDGCQN